MRWAGVERIFGLFAVSSSVVSELGCHGSVSVLLCLLPLDYATCEILAVCTDCGGEHLLCHVIWRRGFGARTQED